MQFFYVESNIENNYSPQCQWWWNFQTREVFCLQMQINCSICKQKNIFTGFIGSNFQVEFLHLLRVFREQFV